MNLGAYEMVRGDQKDFECKEWKFGIAVLEVSTCADSLSVLVPTPFRVTPTLRSETRVSVPSLQTRYTLFVFLNSYSCPLRNCFLTLDPPSVTGNLLQWPGHEHGGGPCHQRRNHSRVTNPQEGKGPPL